MNIELTELLNDTLKEIKENVRQLDTKFDKMHEILIENSAVLKEHERRSTSSEKRLDIVENKLDNIEQSRQHLKGFFGYTGIIFGAISCLAGILYYLKYVLNR